MTPLFMTTYLAVPYNRGGGVVLPSSPPGCDQRTGQQEAKNRINKDMITSRLKNLYIGSLLFPDINVEKLKGEDVIFIGIFSSPLK